MISTSNPGRLTGLLYLLASIPGAFALVYVPGKLLVHESDSATISNIATSQSLFRLGIGAELLCQTLFILVAISLHGLLKGVNQRQAALMVIFILAAVPIAFLNELNSVAALLLVRGDDLLASLGQPQRDALAMLFFKLHGHGLEVAAIFWGLWLFPMGLLVYRSGFIPRILGVLLIFNCFAYLLKSVTSLVMPQYAGAISQWVVPLQFGELAFIFWLLIMGARPAPFPGPPSASPPGELRINRQASAGGP